ncbi:MAG: DUF1990 family protein [Limisphaerales bacterium]
MKLIPCICGPKLTLEKARTLEVNFHSTATLPEQITEIAIGQPAPIHSYRTDFLFTYDIFPSSLMRAEPQWVHEQRAMRVGDIIVQRAVLPPIGFGLCAEFAVRISTVFSHPTKIGFAYETLTGHVERGVSEFYFEDRNGAIFFIIHTHSEPGHWLSRLGGSFFTLPYQRWCTRQALRHVKKCFYRDNPNVAA